MWVLLRVAAIPTLRGVRGRAIARVPSLGRVGLRVSGLRRVGIGLGRGH